MIKFIGYLIHDEFIINQSKNGVIHQLGLRVDQSVMKVKVKEMSWIIKVVMIIDHLLLIS